MSDSKGAAIRKEIIGYLSRVQMYDPDQMGEFAIEEHADLILALLAQEVNKARIDEHEIILGRYAELYNRLSKEHGVSQPVPHTAFHQLSKERTKDLERLG